jgi:hypothetical protein
VTQELRGKLSEIYHGSGPPDAAFLGSTIAEALAVLQQEPDTVRPADGTGRPGGLVFLDPRLPTIVVPDLHARRELFLSVMGYEAEPGVPVIEMLGAGQVQVVCLGDGIHAEGRAERRWRAAQAEFLDGYQAHQNMDEEMRESLGVMAMVMEVKRSFPDRFHFLKGNHENITNESGNGNLPFRKYALEGIMVLSYMQKFYGQAVLAEYARFEKELPLLAVGNSFLLSHAEPARYFPPLAVIGYHEDPRVITGLTWTDNGEAAPGSVQQMLGGYLGEEAARSGYYFGGHRPAIGSYCLRAEGRFVQIHDPARFVIAHLPAEGPIDLDHSVRQIDEQLWWEYQ